MCLKLNVNCPEVFILGSGIIGGLPEIKVIELLESEFLIFGSMPICGKKILCGPIESYP